MNEAINIKKHIYSKAQVAKIIFPPGFGDIALQEVQSILDNLWIAKKFTGKMALLKNEIQIRSIYFNAIVELLLRNHCFTDVRLVIFKETVIGKKAFAKICREINWDYYLNKKMTVKVKVNSIASQAFHETGLKEILTSIIDPYVQCVVTGEEIDVTTQLYVEFYKNKLTISVSLAGQPLYKRGYREQLSKSAPLREDVAACAIQKAILFAKQEDPSFIAHTILIPFSGTGTLAFEYFQLNPVFFERLLALESMPLFKQTHFDLLVNKVKEIGVFIDKNSQIICIDSSMEAVKACEKNYAAFKKALPSLPDIVTIRQGDFFSINPNEFNGNIFMSLNPPYGIRLRKDFDVTVFYKKIALKIREIARKAKQVTGFILCPTEESWSAFLSQLKDTKVDTYHMTQGGLDIRVCQFWI